jgi:hypothetical protein
MFAQIASQTQANEPLSSNIHLLMMIYWTPTKINNLHPRELGHKHMKGNLDKF